MAYFTEFGKHAYYKHYKYLIHAYQLKKKKKVSEKLSCLSAKKKQLSFLQDYKARHFCSIDVTFGNREAEYIINHFYSQMKFCVT